VTRLSEMWPTREQQRHRVAPSPVAVAIEHLNVQIGACTDAFAEALAPVVEAMRANIERLAGEIEHGARRRVPSVDDRSSHDGPSR
jgi:hypothetical protein